ncbi:hypothetical protein PT23B2_28720 (plasmid) [Acinetobacter towneri]
MTELEKHLLEALEQAQAQQQQREADLLKMFESTKQDSQREANLQRYLGEYERSRPDQKRQLEQINSACKQLELASARLQDTKQSLDRAIAGIRNASQQVKEINEPKRSYSIRM